MDFCFVFVTRAVINRQIKIITPSSTHVTNNKCVKLRYFATPSEKGSNSLFIIFLIITYSDKEYFSLYSNKNSSILWLTYQMGWLVKSCRAYTDHYSSKQSSSRINGKMHIIRRSLFTEADHTIVTLLGQGCARWCVISGVKYNLVHLAALSTRVVKNNSQTGVAATIITPYEHHSWKTGSTPKFGRV